MSRLDIDLIQVDALNLGGGITLAVMKYVYLPPTGYETVTWILGVCVALSLIALNVVKLVQAVKRKP